MPSSTAPEDEKALVYHDVVLRRRDVSLLQGPNWINDQVFYGLSTTAAGCLLVSQSQPSDGMTI